MESDTPIELLVSRVWNGTKWHYPNIERMVEENNRLRAEIERLREERNEAEPLLNELWERRTEATEMRSEIERLRKELRAWQDAHRAHPDEFGGNPE